MKGITVTLHVRTQSDTDAFNRPIYTDSTVSVDNVLVGEPTAEDITSDIAVYGKRQAYTLAIPKDDENDWNDTTVEFFDETFRTYAVTQGIDHLIPLSWNKKVKVERYE